MEIAALVLHYVTLLVLVVGYLQSMNPGWATKLMAWGARLQLLSGLGIAGVASMGGPKDRVSPVFLAVKLVVMIVALALTEMSHARGKRGQAQPVLVHAAIGAVLLNMVLAYTLPR